MTQELTKQIMVRISEQDYDDLKRRADREERDVSYWVRRAIKEKLFELGDLDAPAPDPASWQCLIGEADRSALPQGSDSPMRDAVSEAYEEITGQPPAFIFSGWGARVSEVQRAVIENRLPRNWVDDE